MKSFGRFIAKHLASFLIFVVILLLFNTITFFVTFYGIITKDYGKTVPQKLLPVVAQNCSINGISEEISIKLHNNHIWAMFLNTSGQLMWEIDLPKEIPNRFTVSDVALFSKGYIKDYPVFVWTTNDGLLILGYPKGSYTKLTRNYFSVKTVKTLPYYFIGLFAADSILLLIAYFWSKKKIMKHTQPIISSIKSLSEGKPIVLKINGEFEEIAESINKTSLILNNQNIARANWISGVSHDIRTPLSIIMGYADRICQNNTANEQIKEQAKLIRKQSSQMKELISDLNLVSKLEYETQPLQMEQIRVSKLLRSYAADLINSGLPDLYSLDITISPVADNYLLKCDTRLLTRAINNLVQNSIKHNPNGCAITLELEYTAPTLKLIIRDNGVGITAEKIKELERPHYWESTDEKLNLRHGLGLLLVHQIVESHHGTMKIQNLPHGFETIIWIEEH